MGKKKIFITGGHLTPALAIIEKIIRDGYPYELVFIGRKYAMEDDVVPSEEIRIIKSLNIRFLPLTTGRLRRYWSVGTIVSLLKIPVGLLQALFYCIRERPDVIISFGGYVAIPVVISGWLLGIPSVTHEQSRKLGLANRVISFFSKRICLTWPDTCTDSHSGKIVVTGLPIRQAVLSPPDKPTFPYENHSDLLYIQGGVTGSRTLNNVLFPIIPELVKRYIVIHQTGRRWLRQGQDVRKTLPETEKKRYLPLPYLETNDHAWVLGKAHMVIARSGANTVSELAVTNKVAILIPLSSQDSDQTDNARFLMKAGSAEYADETLVSGTQLLSLIHTMEKKYSVYKQRASLISVRNGTEMVVNEINTVLNVK